jgi:hypothetical protein
MRASALALLATSFAVAAPALADTRIFSVETDRPGVTITTVSRNGQPLASSGASGAKTFFTIDGGAAAVPCSNQLAFTASNGQRLEFIVDLCAHNWQVKLPLGTAEAPATPPAPPPPGAPPAPPAPPASAQPGSITIYTDTAGIGINEVFLEKQPVAIASRNQNGVLIALPPGPVQCERDLGLALSDGRRIARTVNICQPNGVVVVALNSSAEAPPPPVAGPIAPPAPPGVPPAPPVAGPVPPAPPSGGPIVIDNLQWTSGADGNRATLMYALPQSDNIEFHASCNRGSGQIDISLERSSPETQEGGEVPVTITAGTFARTYNATGSEINAITGESHPEFSTDVADQLWPEVIRGDYLVIQTGSAQAYALSLKGSSAAAKPFLAACGQASAQPGVPPPPPQGGGQAGGDYACGEEGTLASQKSNLEARLIFTNRMPFPVQLYWLDYNGRREPRLTLAPGETGVQPTFFTHPWLAADTSGRCLAIYYARRGDFGVTVGQ